MKDVHKTSNDVTKNLVYFPNNQNRFDPNPTDLDSLDENFERNYFLVFLNYQPKGFIIDLAKDLYPEFWPFSRRFRKVDRMVFRIITEQTYLNFYNDFANMKSYEIKRVYRWTSEGVRDFDEEPMTIYEKECLLGDQLEEGKDFRNPRFYSMDNHEKVVDLASQFVQIPF